MNYFKSKNWKIIKRFRMLVRGPKNLIDYWIKHQQISYHNPNMVMYFPVSLQYDDINAIKIGKVFVGAFCEICVLAKSEYSNTPGQLIIEDNTIIGSHGNLRATGGKIYIGKNTLIAQQVSLIASNHSISNEQPYHNSPWDESKTGVFIDENVWIGAGVTVLPGCSIGKNSIIGAGSVVTKSIPANEIWVGVPAIKLRDIDSSEGLRHLKTKSINSSVGDQVNA
jgi:acetyltransferase-like isoleucine patch superfamily enzyme